MTQHEVVTSEPPATASTPPPKAPEPLREELIEQFDGYRKGRANKDVDTSQMPSIVPLFIDLAAEAGYQLTTTVGEMRAKSLRTANPGRGMKVAQMILSPRRDGEVWLEMRVQDRDSETAFGRVKIELRQTTGGAITKVHEGQLSTQAAVNFAEATKLIREAFASMNEERLKSAK